MRILDKQTVFSPKPDYGASFKQGAAYAAGILAVDLLANAIGSIWNLKKEEDDSEDPCTADELQDH